MIQILVVIPTFYTDTNDIRFQLAVQTLQQCVHHELEAIVVDASPSDEIRTALADSVSSSSSLTTRLIQVHPQTYQGKKGAALREGIGLAMQRIKNFDVSNKAIICFQEPEKVDMVREWRTIANLLIANEGQEQQPMADICVPRRSLQSFVSSYPIEQYHSETFANLYLDALAKEVGFPSVDWTMGPIAFCPNMAKHWAEDSSCYKGDLWDMQLVPMVRAQRWDGARIISYEFDFTLPEEMKEQESGVAMWSEKRLFQLNHLFQHVSGALKETMDPNLA